MTAEIIVSSFNAIGCDAFSPGSKDFAGGLAFLSKMQNSADFPFISANILDANGNRLFDPYTIVEKDGISVGIIGLASNFVHSEVSVRNPADALAEVVDEVDSQCDVLVLLFDSTEADISQVQSAAYPIDFTIRSRSKKRSQDGGTKNILEYSCGDRGKYLYQFDLAIVEPGKKFTDLATYENLISQAEKRLNKMKQGNLIADLRNLYQDDPLSLNKIDNYEKQITDAKAVIGDVENTIKMSKHELDKNVPDRPDILDIVDNGKAKIEQVVGPQPDKSPILNNHNHHNHNHPH